MIASSGSPAQPRNARKRAPGSASPHYDVRSEPSLRVSLTLAAVPDTIGTNAKGDAAPLLPTFLSSHHRSLIVDKDFPCRRRAISGALHRRLSSDFPLSDSRPGRLVGPTGAIRIPPGLNCPSGRERSSTAALSSDPVERRLLRPAQSPSPCRTTIVQLQRLKARFGLRRAAAGAARRCRPAGKRREHGGLIARACADLEHALLRASSSACGHQRHDIRLADGLAAGDRQRRVLIGLAGMAPRRTARAASFDRLQHARIGDALPAQCHDQARSGGDPAHRATPRSNAFKSVQHRISVRSRCSGVTEMRCATGRRDRCPRASLRSRRKPIQ